MVYAVSIILTVILSVGGTYIYYTNLFGKQDKILRRIEGLETQFDRLADDVGSFDSLANMIGTNITLMRGRVEALNESVQALTALQGPLNDALENVPEPVDRIEAVLIDTAVNVVEWCMNVYSPWITGDIENFQQCIVTASISFCTVVFPSVEDRIYWENCVNPTAILNAGEIQSGLGLPPLFQETPADGETDPA